MRNRCLRLASAPYHLISVLVMTCAGARLLSSWLTLAHDSPWSPTRAPAKVPTRIGLYLPASSALQLRLLSLRVRVALAGGPESPRRPRPTHGLIACTPATGLLPGALACHPAQSPFNLLMGRTLGDPCSLQAPQAPQLLAHTHLAPAC